MNSSSYLSIFGCLASIFIIGCVSGISCESGVKWAWKTLRFVRPLYTRHCAKTLAQFNRIILLIVVLDFLATFIGLCCTGGPERSWFTPFLFTITTVLVMLEAMTWHRICFFAAVAIAIFATSLFEPVREFIFEAGNFKFKNETYHRIFLIVATSICFIIPLLCDLLRKPVGQTPPDPEQPATEAPEQGALIG